MIPNNPIRDQLRALAGKTVTITAGPLAGKEYRVEGLWDEITEGSSWMEGKGNPACILYGIRSGSHGYPSDNDVIYGKVDGLGHLIHACEIGLLEYTEPRYAKGAQAIMETLFKVNKEQRGE